MTKEELDKLYQGRLDFINNKDNADAMTELKANYTFHALKFEDGMEPWFDLWKRKK